MINSQFSRNFRVAFLLVTSSNNLVPIKTHLRPKKPQKQNKTKQRNTPTNKQTKQTNKKKQQQQTNLKVIHERQTDSNLYTIYNGQFKMFTS